MLKIEDKKKLNKLAHKLKPVFQIGKGGENSKQLESILEYLYVHEMVKVSILSNAPEDKHYFVNYFEDANIEVVNLIGKTIILYKYSHNPNKKSEIKL